MKDYNYKIEKSNITEDIAASKKNKKWKLLILIAVGAAVLVVGGFLFNKASNVLTVTGGSDVGKYKDFSVEKENNRIDVLVLGIRGAGDRHGGLLTDSIMLFSFDKTTKKAVMVSLPRDLYVEMPEHHQPEKINFAYALGEQRSPGGGGLALSKEVVQYVTGVYIDHAVVVNFDGFEKIVNIMGGVEIYRDTAFFESQQWQGEGNPNSKFWYKETEQPAQEQPSDNPTTTDNEPTDKEDPPRQPREYWVFQVPKGYSVLDGEAALYYVRSRYTSSDFDRMRRQQQVIASLKSKAFSLGVAGNPIKVFEILDTVGNNVRTDMSLGDIRGLISLAREYSDTPIESASIEASDDSFLYSSNINGSYVLLPKGGNFEQIRNFIKNITNQ